MKEEIDRIAGRMVHRADATLEFLEDVAARKRILQRRTDDEDSGRAQKLEDLDERADRLARAANDYRKAERMIRAFPALIESLDEWDRSSWYVEGWKGPIPPLVLKVKAALKAAQKAFK